MENKDKPVMPLGTDFEVLDDAPPAAAGPAAAPAGGGRPAPLRKTLAAGSEGLLVALGGLLGPFPAEASVLARFAAAWVVWDLVCHGLARVRPAYRPHQPWAGALALLAGALGLALALGGDGPMLGPVGALVGGALALLLPGLQKKKDAKLPPPPPEEPLDPQFSKSLLAYLLMIAGLVSPWSTGGRGADTVLGLVTLVFCVIGVWASWVGTWRLWAMPAISGGMLGAVLLLAPIEAILLGTFGLVRLKAGDQEALQWIVDAWPGEVVPAAHVPAILLTIGAGVYGTTILFKGVKSGMEANKQRQAAEVEARKAARAARKKQQASS